MSLACKPLETARVCPARRTRPLMRVHPGTVPAPRLRCPPRDARARAKRSKIEPRVISGAGARGRDASDEKPTPLSPEKLKALPPEMLVDDPWADESFDGLGKIASAGLVIVAIVSAIAGGVATSTYNEGAVEVDFQQYSSPQEAVADSLRKVNAVEAMKTRDGAPGSNASEGVLEEKIEDGA